MKIKQIVIISILLGGAAVANAGTNDLPMSLQRGLFEEEANHQLDAAIVDYKAAIENFDHERQLAATAIFRLGECYRKLGKTNEANAQYERLVREFREAAAREGLVTPDGTLGIVVTGALDEKLFRAIAAIIPEGTWEFVCHPGYNDDDLRSANTRLRESRETELRVLTMPEARELLLQQGIDLISYRDLIPAGAGA